ncbi:hypothetical protein [Citrobacter farmeri]|uniref:hypothetical protein n=1 Tax=Citrobacter farmeri TaxID=67824 RepID=UPI001902B9A6|nr:hypothetical protein [Citrobacter farmeri]MBJ9137944.1 hypothetical protein [Citrobacter farmeri]
MKIIILAAGILSLTGCISQGMVDGKKYTTEYRARERCAIDFEVRDNYHELVSASNFKVSKVDGGNWKCRKVFGDELKKQQLDSNDEYEADRSGLSLSQYRDKKKNDYESLKNAYINYYTAKERVYEEYRKDGKLHTDVSSGPDGVIRATSIQGNARCETVIGDSGGTSSCE